MMFGKIGVLKIWKKSLKICVKELLIQLKASSLLLCYKMNSFAYIFKGFSYILMNLLWFSTFFGTTFYRKSPISNCSFWNSEDVPSLVHGIFYFISRYTADQFVDSLEEMVADRKKKGRRPRRIRYDIYCRWALYVYW